MVTPQNPTHPGLMGTYTGNASFLLKALSRPEFAGVPFKFLSGKPDEFAALERKP